MSWRDAIGDFLERFDKPNTPLGSAETPFNYALQASFNTDPNRSRVTAETLQAAFPGLTKSDAETALAKADAAGRQALEIYYNVRDGILSESAAEAKLKTAYPEISQANFHVLRAKSHMAASK
ncbi:hypothetical protein J0X19_14160 [Hymenobacter sp. BT186]|uniref:Uncharacterized protein n=1 Tax=Hymenobacter telluris TaxID=2816474 RepID=A0A939EX34_9BACT|nr:hypothetical protein [Hymenobacter telluris]MBO0359100.1 hypothetical protein [Hymenobacter telluris]MBW3375126.1 hypothetical protein [Hymenobacter norwichensis]